MNFFGNLACIHFAVNAKLFVSATGALDDYDTLGDCPDSGLDCPRLEVQLLQQHLHIMEEAQSTSVSALSKATSKTAMHSLFKRCVEPLIPGYTAAAIAISLCGATISVVGFALQKKALSVPRGCPRVGDLEISPLWLAGFLCVSIVPPLGDFLSYSLAPMSLIQPLSGAGVLANLAISKLIHGEELRPKHLVAAVLIVFGLGLTTVTGAKEEPQYTLSDLQRFAQQPLAVVVFSGLFVLWVSCVYYQLAHAEDLKRCAEKQPSFFEIMLPAVTATTSGAMTNINLKCLGKLLVSGLGVGWCILWFLYMVLPFAAMQLYFLNKGLKLYEQLTFQPIYSALLVLFGTLTAGVFFEEYEILLQTGARLKLFLLGLALIVSGIWCLSCKDLSVNSIRFAVSLLTLSVSFLIMAPGVFGTHLTFGTDLGAAIGGPDLGYDRLNRLPFFSQHDLSLGIWNITVLLFESVDMQPIPSFIGCIVFTWGVILPLTKGVVLACYILGASSFNSAVEFVQWLSKWAMADVFIPLVWTAIVRHEDSNNTFQTKLHLCYYLFVVHVVLSIIGVLLLKPPEEEAEEEAEEEPQTERRANALGTAPHESPLKAGLLPPLVGVCFLLSIFYFSIFKGGTKTLESTFPEKPVYHGVINSTIYIVHQLEDLELAWVRFTVYDYLHVLWYNGYSFEVVLTFVFAVVFPTLEYSTTVAVWMGWRVNLLLQFFIESFAMFDVFVLAVLTASAASVTFKGDMVCLPTVEGLVFALFSLSWTFGLRFLGKAKANSRSQVPVRGLKLPLRNSPTSKDSDEMNPAH
eukprot:CAMPEP_0117578144 /NCGR_PEP_ID=MMETSP0784-20121206/63831_1 /TAXON_ID=39447 /ORGANISM="" /LENGTH=801 /DNA_ID=CAMNT_0005377757 /DNA_START=54 /DNA_END=2459 /DNA_ORIENTATION=-